MCGGLGLVFVFTNCMRSLFFPLRACEPADSLVSLVSTNNLMLVMFKAAQIKERKEFHGYLEVITQESKFVEECVYCIVSIQDSKVAVMFLTMNKWLLYLGCSACLSLSFLSSALASVHLPPEWCNLCRLSVFHWNSAVEGSNQQSELRWSRLLVSVDGAVIPGVALLGTSLGLRLGDDVKGGGSSARKPAFRKQNLSSFVCFFYPCLFPH